MTPFRAILRHAVEAAPPAIGGAFADSEGEMVDGRLRVEEIQEDGVALSDQGRRFTLRVAR